MALRKGRRGAVTEYPKCVTVRVTTDSFSSELLCGADSVMNAVSELHTMRVV
jgi:hypothetical protein